jgi:hypothetical protein
MTDLPLTGRCQCGAAAYAVSAEPVAVYVCHCRECQRQSASAFGISVSVPKSAFRLERGEVSTWSRRTDTGRTLDCKFCPVCGTRLWHEGAGWDELSVKGGSLDRPVDLGGAIHIWTARRLPGVVVPDGARQYPGEPS